MRTRSTVTRNERATKQRIELKLNEAQRALREAHKLSNDVAGGEVLERSLNVMMVALEDNRQRVRALISGANIG
jgi:cellobiose-specific phosphotransferase system component IIA